jgi:hypothetical protein
MTFTRTSLLLTLCLGPLACGGGSTVGANPSGLLPDLPGPAATVGGGAAEGASGNGTDAGALKITSRGELLIDPSMSAASGATPPATPAGGTIVTDADLQTDLSSDGTIRIEGTITAGGSDTVRTLTSSAGDIVIAGTLRGADLGGSTQGLSLNAPAGTVYVGGSVDASGAAAANGSGNGAAGGEITISARSIVVVGLLDTSGGDAVGSGAVTGGAAGAVRLTAHGDMWLARVRLHGGGAKSSNASATGGAAAALTADADGTLQVTDLVDARGGPAIATGAASAGAAGTIAIGQTAPPTRVVMGVALGLEGGAGPDGGGAGGALTLEARGGDLRIAGTADVSGGASRGRPGNAGPIDATVGPDAGGFALTGRLVGDGGAAEPGGNAAGGLGARLRIQVTSQMGGYTIPEGAAIQLDGGASSGTGTAGGGGDMEMVGVDGDFSRRGQILARGGDAPDPGGVGGQGGILHVWTDTNHNGVGGTLIIEPTGVIDVSAGPGTTGGSGRNNGGEGVALFPVHMEQLSVLLDGETIGGNSQDGVVDNRGVIISRGGVHDGSGGDVMFHGRNPNGEDKTVPGHIENQGDGAGLSGDFAGE